MGFRWWQQCRLGSKQGFWGIAHSHCTWQLLSRNNWYLCSWHFTQIIQCENKTAVELLKRVYLFGTQSKQFPSRLSRQTMMTNGWCYLHCFSTEWSNFILQTCLIQYSLFMCTVISIWIPEITCFHNSRKLPLGAFFNQVLDYITHHKVQTLK